MSEQFEYIKHNEKILAVIIRAQHIKESSEPVAFATPDTFPFQVGVHNRKKGEALPAHVHLPFSELKDFPVQEFFYVISGKVKIDLYGEQDTRVGEVIIQEGDSIVLNCGHGFTFLDDAKLIELKQGPYRGKEQEKRFIEGKIGGTGGEQ